MKFRAREDSLLVERRVGMRLWVAALILFAVGLAAGAAIWRSALLRNEQSSARHDGVPAVIHQTADASLVGAPDSDRTVQGRSSLEGIFDEAARFTPKSRALLLQNLRALSVPDAKQAITRLMTDPQFAAMQDLVSAAAASWLASDSQSFAMWAKQTFDEEVSSQVLLLSLTSLPISQALPLWSTITTAWREEQARFVTPIAAALAERNPSAAFSAVASVFANPGQLQEARSAVVDTWAQTAPEEALAAIQSLSSGEGREMLVANVVSRWTDVAPAAAEAYLSSSLTPIEVRRAGIAVLAEVRAAQDPLAAMEWLATLPNDAVGADALVNLSQHLSFTDPLRALQVAARIEETSLRTLHMSELILSWAAVDPVAARSYMLEHPFSDPQEQQRVLSKINVQNGTTGL